VTAPGADRLADLTADVRALALRLGGYDYCVRLEVDGLGVILWDGAVDPPEVTNLDEPADAVIRLTPDTLAALVDGSLSPEDAWMDELVGVEGSSTAAIRLGQLLLDRDKPRPG
jgi:hypothetical protein